MLFLLLSPLLLLLPPSTIGDKPQQVHLALTKRQRELTATWVTFEPEESELHFRSLTKPFSTTVVGSRTTFVNSANVTRFVHRALMTDLEPGASYIYQVGSGFNVSREFVFTALAAHPPYRVCIFGDLGVENGESIPSLIAEADKRSFDLIIHVGDIAYDLGADGGRVGDKFMTMLEPLFASVPYMVIAGNHEEEWGTNFSSYRALFTMPDEGYGDNQFYSFDLGPIHFVGVSTEFYGYYYAYGMEPVLTQYAWLKKDLEAHAAQRVSLPWLISFQHRPFYCSNDNSHECASFENRLVRTGFLNMPGLEPLYEAVKMDISFWGHEHSYERFFPRTNTSKPNPYHDADGPTYIISGSAGCHSGYATFAPKPVPFSAKRINDYGYSLLHVYNSTHIFLEQISVEKSGAVVDSAWLTKSPERIESYRTQKSNLAKLSTNGATAVSQETEELSLRIAYSFDPQCHPRDIICQRTLTQVNM